MDFDFDNEGFCPSNGLEAMGLKTRLEKKVKVQVEKGLVLSSVLFLVSDGCG